MEGVEGLGTFGRHSTAMPVPSLSALGNAGGEELLGLFDAIWWVARAWHSCTPWSCLLLQH
jgi:hypothetical protein